MINNLDSNDAKKFWIIVKYDDDLLSAVYDVPIPAFGDDDPDAPELDDPVDPEEPHMGVAYMNIVITPEGLLIAPNLKIYSGYDFPDLINKKK